MKKIFLNLLIIFVFGLLLVGCNKEKEKTNIDDKDKSSKEFVIVDETEVCAQALEEIYRDSDYIYYLSCIKSGNITIKFEDGRVYTLREVLNNNILTIDELIDKGLAVYKTEIKK